MTQEKHDKTQLHCKHYRNNRTTEKTLDEVLKIDMSPSTTEESQDSGKFSQPHLLVQEFVDGKKCHIQHRVKNENQPPNHLMLDSQMSA